MTQDIKVGTQIEVSVYTPEGKTIWEKKTITRVSDAYVWFNGSGYSRIKKTTLFNFPTLYRVL